MTLILAFSCFHFSFKVNSWPTKAHRSRWTFDGESRKSYVNLQRFDDLVKLPNMTRRFKYANFMHTARRGGRGRVNGLSFTGQSPRVRKWCIIRNGIFRSFYFWIILNDLNQIIPLIPPLSFMHVTLLLTWLFKRGNGCWPFEFFGWGRLNAICWWSLEALTHIHKKLSRFNVPGYHTMHCHFKSDT